MDTEVENGTITEIQYQAQELYGIISEFAVDNNINIQNRQFPKDAASFVKKIKTVILNFKAGYGIIINIGRVSKDNTSIITLSRSQKQQQQIKPLFQKTILIYPPVPPRLR